jgi:hypothetical protein
MMIMIAYPDVAARGNKTPWKHMEGTDEYT